MKLITLNTNLDIVLAGLVQSANTGRIIRKKDGKVFNLFMMVGNVYAALISNDGDETVFNPNKEDIKEFYVSVNKYIPDALEGRTPFEYNGRWFIGAGTFEENAIDTDFKALTRRLIHHESKHEWSYDRFKYKAEQAGYAEDDIFYCLDPLSTSVDDFYVCPGSNELFKFAR